MKFGEFLKEKREEQVDIEFVKKDGTLERLTIKAISKKDFKKKLNQELEKRNMEYIDYNKWSPVKSDREHRWFK
jgi:predicted aldo/keto reductase-like oxidoreductase